jgi:HSP20 family molecular chaperone IbpA
MADTKVTKVKEDAVQAVEQPERETAYLPDVDVRESNEAVRLLVDMPGVAQDGVSVTVDKGVLTVEGKAQVEVPEGHELAGQEYGVGRFRRDFALPDAVNADGIKARMSHGVLHVTLPKRETVKTKKIEIES